MLREVTLAQLLFADASTLKLEQVRDDAGLSARLLTIGLVLTIAAGAGVALILHPQEGLAFACLLGAILAPTDAALGLSIFNIVFRYHTSWRPILYAILSLTVVRMAPMALALRGVGLRRDTVTLMGWFGPRGLASVSLPCWPWSDSRRPAGRLTR